MNQNKELPCDLIRCNSCIHKEVCAHMENMGRYANIVKTALEGIFTSSDPITIFESQFPSMFVLPMINCKHYQMKSYESTFGGRHDNIILTPHTISEAIPTADQDSTTAVELPYPYPNGGAGTILLKKDGTREVTGKGCLVETEIHDHSSISGKAFTNSCEGSYLEN